MVVHALFLSLTGFSQDKVSAIIEKGSVVDETTKLPVEGATINFYSAGQLAATNEQGKFSIKLSLKNQDSLIVSAIGYEADKDQLCRFFKKRQDHQAQKQDHRNERRKGGAESRRSIQADQQD